MGGFLMPSICTANVFKNFFDRPFKRRDEFILCSLKVKSEATSALAGEKLVLRLATGGTGKLPGPEDNWSAACHGDSKPANLSTPPCSPNKQVLLRPAPTHERQVKTQKLVLCGGLLSAPIKYNGAQ
jgi:hypothetical protein